MPDYCYPPRLWCSTQLTTLQCIPVTVLTSTSHSAGLILATLTTNIAANVVAPANAIVNIAPGQISFTAGGIITAVLGVVILPWRLLSSSSGFVNWLVGYSALLGPVVGVVMADYYIIRQRQLDIDGLYSMSPKGQYWYQVRWRLLVREKHCWLALTLLALAWHP